MNHRIAPLISLCILLILICAPALGRDVVPTPPGGGPGVNVVAADQLGYSGRPASRFTPQTEWRHRPDAVGEAAVRISELGGDDVTVVRGDLDNWGSDLAVASNGDLFALICAREVGDTSRTPMDIWRSTDGGTTWDLWYEFPCPSGTHYFDHSIEVAEGDADRVFVAYSVGVGAVLPEELHVAWSPLDVTSGDFSQDTLIHTSDDMIVSLDFTTDQAMWSDYFCYLIFSDENGDGADIHFVRSIDQGTTWESSYSLGNISVDDRGYMSPQITVGSGGWVHASWYLWFEDGHEYDNSVRYRRAASFANGGLSAWENQVTVTSHNNEVDEFRVYLAASPTSQDVAMVWNQLDLSGGGYTWDGAMIRTSSDGGATWSANTQFITGYTWIDELAHQTTTDRWVLAGDDYDSHGLQYAPVSNPTSWTARQHFGDVPTASWHMGSIALDPSHDERVALLTSRELDTSDYAWLFDAEWRADEGYPNLEDGFPVDLTWGPDCDPALVDMDGNGTLEIVFGDASGRIQVYRHDGTPLPGWPVDTGHGLSDSPLAVGDLNGDGSPEVVAGTSGGMVLAYTAAGDVLPGWPVDTDREAEAHVVIGAIGGPYPRAVIYACDDKLYALDYHGDPWPGQIWRTFPGRVFNHPPAVGDVDGDGRSEVALMASHHAYAVPMTESGAAIWEILEDVASGPVSLGDFDLDGDVEMVIPLANGVLHVLDDDGDAFPGAWPVDTGLGALNGAAVAQILGVSNPEIIVSGHDGDVSVFLSDGDEGYGWPNDVGGWYVYSKPIVGVLDGSPDVIVGARGRKAWSWSNLGQLNPGWPKTVDHHIYQTPAYGDLDQDGSAEVVLLSTDQLIVVDVNQPPSVTPRAWPMAGFDSERSGCHNCQLDLVPVLDDPTAVTRISMAAPHPNPVAGQAEFRFAVPVPAVVELSIHDVRGRRVSLVSRQELPAGQHSLQWLGRDDHGRPVASGQYLAALRVRGAGVDETVTRKITVLK